MRLRSIEIHGFKTFATHTELLFDESITAIVGPNGSGKSNIADAIRWVLGEQSYRTLRSKRTEDLIFSGSEKRPRMGMASVTLTLDNSTHWLPVDFQEVAISRRAYRSGENIYKLNSKRVRLADINDLLGETGLSRRTYMVIGQGLVDRALSLRPEERRALFEEAAGIATYQQKRTLSLNRLAETKSNLIRVHDIITEMEPRLRYLERQASRAREIEKLQEELRGLLRRWYGYRWTQAQARKQAAEAEASRQQSTLLEIEKSVNALNSKIPQVEAQRHQLQDEIREWRQELDGLSRQKSGAERSIAVAGERLRLLQAQREEIADEISQLERESNSIAEEMKSLQEEAHDLDAERQRQEVLVREAEGRLALWKKARADLEIRLEGAKRASDRYQAELYQIRRRLEEQRDENERVEQERAELREVIASTEEELEQKKEALSKAQSTLEDSRKALEETEERIRTLRARGDSLRRQTENRRAAVAEVKQHILALEERRRLLERLQEEGAGLYGGVRRVMQARNRLPGIVGIVGELLEVPKELELAIEVALGSHQQDVVVRRWADAEKAIGFLKREKAGRATFLPLDTVRSRRPLQTPEIPGVIGVASELVSAPAELRNVVTHLLGRTVVTQRLAVAREVLKQVQGGYQVVTPEGEVVQSSGSITGGSRRQRGPDILSRNREIKALPEQIADLQKSLQTKENDLKEAESALQALESDLEGAEKELTAQAHRARDAQEAWLKAREAKRTAEQQARWHESRMEELLEVRKRLDEAERRLHEEMTEASRKRKEKNAEIADLSLKLRDSEPGPESNLAAEASDLQAALASIAGRLQQSRSELETQRQRLAQMSSQMQGKRSRMERLVAEIAETQEAIAREEASLTEIESRAAELGKMLEPAQKKVAGLDRWLEETQKKHESLRAGLQAQEERYRQALLDKERTLDAIQRLRSEIEEANLNYAFLPPEANGNPAGALPLVSDVEEGLKEAITSFRVKLRRMGGASPEVLDEYESVKSHYDFLQQQAEDLEKAITSLKEVIARLDKKMEEAFLETYNAIAREFKAYFTRLFGGGHAYLRLTAPENVSETGVEIFARPPGKRAQGLALLSGGERTLTAASLLFSILKVSPPPFVVLDEVDAALDEANVGRFREALTELSNLTQFVVITHNRGTIETARTVYGVSLRPDGTSQVLSLKLEKLERGAHSPVRENEVIPGGS